MKTKRYDGSDVRKILSGMITNRTVCIRIASQWPEHGLFEAPWANTVGSLVVQYFRKFGGPPGNQMPEVFAVWARGTPAADDVVTAVEKFLREMSDEDHEDAAEYVIDLAGHYFNKVRMSKAIALAKQELEADEVEQAQSTLEAIRRVNLGVGSYIDPGDDIDFWLNTFEKDHVRPLVYYRGELGDFFGDAFQRGRLFSFMAPDKSGKTCWLRDFAYRALRNHNRVAFFDLGDSTQDDFTQGFAARHLLAPPYHTKYNMPVSWDEEEPIWVERESDPLDPVAAYRAYMKNTQMKDKLRVQFHASGSFSADDLNGVLADWDRDDWRPDVVIADYADILAPPKGHRDVLDQIDETWKCLRRISQQRHCLVLTATQASALNYSNPGGLLGKKDFSGRKTKLAHVSGFIGINVTDAEREGGLCRINKFAWRHKRHSEREFVRVAGCHELGNPAILSKRGAYVKKVGTDDSNAGGEHGPTDDHGAGGLPEKTHETPRRGRRPNHATDDGRWE